MRLNFLRKTVREDFVILDSMFPQKEPFGFRNTEINEYLKRIDSLSVYAISPMEPWGNAWFPWSYGVQEAAYNENLEGYLKHYPENKNKVHYLSKNTSYKFKLAYSYFLAETYVLLPFYEKNKIPFMFMLYPGGTFGLENEASDAMLKDIMNSPYFMGVIVSQQITKDYLLKKNFCTSDKISYIYGGYVQFTQEEVLQKKYFKKDKKTFDICFVAAKYTEKGIDKGYDLFIESAIKLSKEAADMRFHVVGNFTEDDIKAPELKNKITFYGYQKKDFFPEFFSGMDVFLSPNRPGKLYEGNFDGFPIGVDAGYCGTAMFVSDELKMNHHFTNNKDIVIIPTESNGIKNIVMEYYNNTDALYELSEMCKDTSQKLFSIEYQLESRLKVFNSVYQTKYGKSLK